MSNTPNPEVVVEYPRHIMLTVAFTQLKEQGMDDIAELLQQMNQAYHAQAKRMSEMEDALSGLADFSEQAGFDCQQARAVLADAATARKANPPAVTDEAHIAMLQEALSFWLPKVQGTEGMAARIANDAWLLCGMLHADVDKPSAEALGWISVNAAPAQLQAGPVPQDLLFRLKQRVLLTHGGQADGWKHHWNLTEDDSLMHKEAAEYIDSLVTRLATQAQEGPLKLVQIRNVALEEAALIADGMDMHIVAAAIRERILTGVPVPTDYAAAEKEHFGDPDRATGIYAQPSSHSITDLESIALAEAIDPATRTATPGNVTLSAAAIALRALANRPAIPAPFPERDNTRTAEQQGLFHKFDVRRTDGSDRPGGKHHGCRYFVLDMTHDPHTPEALRGYAASCAPTHPFLAADLNAEFGQSPEHQLQDAWKAYVAVVEGSPLRPSRHVPDGTYALIARDQWDAFAARSNRAAAAATVEQPEARK